MTLPCVVAFTMLRRRGLLRWVLLASLPLSLAPAFLTLNRAMFLSLGAGLAVLGVRASLRGNVRVAASIVGVVVIGALATLVIPITDLINRRVESSDTNTDRFSLYAGGDPPGAGFAVAGLRRAGERGHGLRGRADRHPGAVVDGAVQPRRTGADLLPGLVRRRRGDLRAGDLAGRAVAGRGAGGLPRAGPVLRHGQPEPALSRSSRSASRWRSPSGNGWPGRAGGPCRPREVRRCRHDRRHPPAGRRRRRHADRGPPPADAGAAETRRSARSGVAGLLGAATSGLFGFVLAVVITRGYGPAGAGAFFAAIGVVTVATAVCTLGAETGLMWALPRRRVGARRDAARVLPVALIPPLLAGLLVAGAGALAADALAPRLLRGSGDDGGALLTVTFAAVPVVVAMTLLLAALRCVRPIRAYVGVQFLLLPVARPALVGAAALAGGGLLAGMTGWLVPAALALLVCLTLVAGPLGLGRGAALRPSRADWSTFWRFALPRAASAAIDAGSMWVGVLLTSVLAGPADAGVFGAVGRYVLAGQLAMQGLRVAVSPQLSRLLGRGERAAAAAVHRQLTIWGLVLSWPVYLLLAVFALAFLQLFGAGVHRRCAGA